MIGYMSTGTPEGLPVVYLHMTSYNHEGRGCHLRLCLSGQGLLDTSQHAYERLIQNQYVLIHVYPQENPAGYKVSRHLQHVVSKVTCSWQYEQ